MTTTLAPRLRTTGAPPVAMRDLVHVELRKLLDTRAGGWLHATVALLCVAVMGAAFALPAESLSGATFVTYGGAIASLLLPVTAILSLTTEWSQGSVITSFVLVPRRSRVVTAKFAALLASAAVFSALLLGTASGAAALARVALAAPAGHWDVTGEHALTLWLGLTLSMLMGAAFGAMFMHPASAIVAYLVLPFAWSIVGQLVKGADDVAPWLDTSVTYSRLLEGTIEGSEQWQQVAVSSLVWVALPLAVGLIRLGRREVK